MKVIILIGQRVRSGTNFLGSTLSQHPDVQTIPPGKSHGEFNLFKDRAISNVLKNISDKSFGVKYDDQDRSEFYRRFGNLILEQLKNKYDLDPNKTVFIKSPFIENYDLWLKAFPTAKIIFLCRDGRDNAMSSVKASLIRKNWFSFIRNAKIEVNYRSGRLFISQIKDWKKTARIYDKVPVSENVTKVRYEDLINSEANLSLLLDFLEVRNTEAIVKKCLNAPVVGSSFGKNAKNKTKSNWIPDHDKSKFKFVKKWEKWSRHKKWAFKAIASQELINLGYEKNNQW